MLRATVVSCSSSCLIAAIWISFSRVIAFSGMIALSNTSESNSTASLTSGLVTSREMLKVLLLASLEMWPPTPSISFAICSAVRVVVPFNSAFAIKRVMPFVWAVSARRPLRNTAPIATSGRRASSRTRTRNPFDNWNFCTSPALMGFVASAFGSNEPLGFNDMTVRFSFVR